MFFLATISAPFFGTIAETIIFLVVLSIATFLIYGFTYPEEINSYHTGVVLLQIAFYFIIAGINKYFLEKIKKEEEEKSALSEEMAYTLERAVNERTRELMIKIDELENLRGRMISLETDRIKEETDNLKKK